MATLASADICLPALSWVMKTCGYFGMHRYLHVNKCVLKLTKLFVNHNIMVNKQIIEGTLLGSEWSWLTKFSRLTKSFSNQNDFVNRDVSVLLRLLDNLNHPSQEQHMTCSSYEGFVLLCLQIHF